MVACLHNRCLTLALISIFTGKWKKKTAHQLRVSPTRTLANQTKPRVRCFVLERPFWLAAASLLSFCLRGRAAEQVPTLAVHPDGYPGGKSGHRNVEGCIVATGGLVSGLEGKLIGGFSGSAGKEEQGPASLRGVHTLYVLLIDDKAVRMGR